ncbi:MAG TPA: rhomboid family intramembrane serine protease [Candidatus Krumholzibacteriaceae bacterium]
MVEPKKLPLEGCPKKGDPLLSYGVVPEKRKVAMPYNRRFSSNPVLDFLTGSVVNQIIVANVIIYVIQVILVRSSFIDIFGLTPHVVLSRGYVWQLVTYMFLHGSPWHLLLNMFIIWMFGTPLEGVWGSNRFLNYYVVCGLGGALLSFLFSFNTTVIGASGAGYGILLAYAILFPYSEIYVWGLFPVRARTLVIFMVVIELVSGITGRDGVAHFAHLGGMGAGFIYLKSDRWMRRLFRRR